jgi:hypothetical protein
MMDVETESLGPDDSMSGVVMQPSDPQYVSAHQVAQMQQQLNQLTEQMFHNPQQSLQQYMYQPSQPPSAVVHNYPASAFQIQPFHVPHVGQFIPQAAAPIPLAQPVYSNTQSVLAKSKTPPGRMARTSRAETAPYPPLPAQRQTPVQATQPGDDYDPFLYLSLSPDDHPMDDGI